MIARLATCLREYRRNAVLAPVFVTLEVGLDVVIPFLMARIIDRGIGHSDMRAIWFIGVMLVAAAVLSLIFGILSGRHAAVASAGLTKNIRHDMFYRIQDFSFTSIDRFSPASLVTRLTTDAANVQESCQLLLRILVRSPLMLVFSMLMAFRVNDTVSLVFLGIAPVLGLGLYFVVTRAQPIFQRVIRSYDRLNTVVRENLRGIRVVKAYVREDFEKQKFAEVSESIYRDYSLAEKLIALNTPLMQFCIYTCTLLLAWFGARLIVFGSMTTGQLLGLLAYAMQILMALMLLSVALMTITVSRASAARIIEVLDEQSDIRNGPDPVTAVPDGSIDFAGVDFGYAGSEHGMTLRDITLSIASGETIGIVGGTGSGKSSLVQLIPRLYDATRGTVRAGGRDVREYDLDALRNAVAMVLQKNTLFAGTVRSNLLWGNPAAGDEDIRHAARLAQADDFITALPDGYDSRVEQGGSNFSGGQRQRLCIARALLKDPKILILDDSTSALDSKTDEAIRTALRDFLPGTTKITIAQRIAQVMHADRIIVMDGGRVTAFAPHDKLLRDNAIYQEMYHSQIKEGTDHDVR